MLYVAAEHTDWEAQRAFLGLPPDQQLLQIWMNGRETNGHVSEAVERISTLEQSARERERRLSTVEKFVIGVSAVGAFLVLAPGGAWTWQNGLTSGGQDVNDTVSGVAASLTDGYKVVSVVGAYKASLSGVVPAAWAGAVVTYR